MENQSRAAAMAYIEIQKEGKLSQINVKESLYSFQPHAPTCKPLGHVIKRLEIIMMCYFRYDVKFLYEKK